MFDYQAGERHKLTIIMTALAGLMAGIFFTVMLMPMPEPEKAHHKHSVQPYMSNPDITGVAPMPGSGVQSAQSSNAQAAPNLAGAASARTIATADPALSQMLIEQWLPLSWDLSAGSANTSQEKAISYMTPECAAAYKQNIWTPDLAKQIEDSGLKSDFKAGSIKASDTQPDGTVIVYVDGVQTLAVPQNGSTSRAVRLEYLIKQTDAGLRIAGISEGGK